MQYKYVCRAWDHVRLLQLPHSKRICIFSLCSLGSISKDCFCWILAIDAAELSKLGKKSNIFRCSFILRKCTKLSDGSVLHLRSRLMHSKKFHDGHDVFMCCTNYMSCNNGSGNSSGLLLYFIVLYLRLLF